MTSKTSDRSAVGGSGDGCDVTGACVIREHSSDRSASGVSCEVTGIREQSSDRSVSWQRVDCSSAEGRSTDGTSADGSSADDVGTSDGGNAEAPSVDSGVDGIAVLALLMCW